AATASSCLRLRTFSGPAFFVLMARAHPAIYSLPLHDALPISAPRSRADLRVAPAAGRGVRRRHEGARGRRGVGRVEDRAPDRHRSEEHTSELQSRENLVCRLLLEKKKNIVC